jgi:hypothetical protein
MVLTSACSSGSNGACAGEKYPAAPAGASETVYVSASCSASGADGTADHPYATIGEAVSKAKAGAAVLVAAGTYKEQLTIDQSMTIAGEVTAGSQGDDGAIILQSPAPYAITVGTGATVTLEGFQVTGAQGVGIWAKGGSVTASGCKIEDTSSYTDKMVTSGYGILASDNGAIILQDSTITGSALGGALFSGVGGSVAGATGKISGSNVSHNHGYGVRLDQTSSPVTIEKSTLTANVGFGVGAFSSGAIILQNQIEDTALDAMGSADGIVTGSNMGVSIPSSVDAEDNHITGSGRVGVLCAAGAGGIILQNNTVSGSGASAPFGAAIWLQQGAGPGAGNLIKGNTLSANKFVGLGLTGATGGIKLDANTITGTTLGSTFVGLNQVSIGDGINVFEGASAMITNNIVSQNGRFGMILDAEDASTSIVMNRFLDNDQYGIILQNQPAMPPSTANNTIMGNKAGATQTVAAGTYGINQSDFATQ